MQILNQLEAEPLPIEDEERRRTRRLFIGIVCALLLTGIVLGGYLYLRKRHEREVATAVENAKTRALAPKVEVLVDDATLNGRQTVLGGTVHNISTETLRNLSVELELRRRVGGGLETRAVTPDQTELAPDGRSRYGLELLAQDYSTARLLRIVAGENRQELPFKALPGAPRPPMPVPAGKTVIVKRPTPRGDEFINTPNNPVRVP
jgi:hypothetical protein